MCGFAGIVGEVPDRSAVVARMTAALVHRGPDDAGAFDDGACSLGHRRLSVIDLSERGRQPMTNEDGTIQLVYNGEIYNFQELRRDLVARGHHFRSATDSEVIVHLYEERGDDVVTALRGMFAFALWDARRRRLVLARDHFGQKPLYYAERAGAIYFGSEIKAIRAAGVGGRPDPRAIDLLLRIQAVPAPHTCFEEIRRLPPATILVRDDAGAVTQRRYWSLADVPRRRIRMDEAVEEAAALCRAAVAEQLVADVPVGIFASGGIDSTLVLATSEALGARLRSFTLGYAEPEHDDTRAAEAALAGRESTHTVVVMQPDDAADPERLVAMFDEPFPDVAALPLAHLARHARADVTVALTGDGGDELFGGYHHHVVGHWLERLGRADRARALVARAILGASVARLPRVQRLVTPLTGSTWREAVALMRLAVTDELRDELYTPELRRAAAEHPDDELLGDGTGIAALFCPSGDRFLADRLLVKTDIAAMASGLETRSPLLDLRIAELAASLPRDLKIHGLRGKEILRRLLARSAPRGVWKRRKTGFGMPLDRWLRSELRDVVADTLLAPRPRVAAYLRPETLARAVAEHQAGRGTWRRVIWTALLLELWLRRL